MAEAARQGVPYQLAMKPEPQLTERSNKNSADAKCFAQNAAEPALPGRIALPP